METIGPIKVDFTDFWHSDTQDAKKNNNLYKLLSQRFDLEICRDPDFVIFSCFGRDFLRHKCVRIFYTGENVRPNYNECDYAFSFEYPVTKKNYRLPLYRLDDNFAQLTDNRDPEEILRQKTKFCSFIYLNSRPTARNGFFRKLSKYKQVDALGPALNNTGGCIQPGYRNKLKVMKPYKFSIAFENSSYPGYTTEKLLHAFVANNVAIYWGNPLVDRDFNTRSFINCHEYRSFDDVIERIIEVDNDDELYKSYLAEPCFRGNVPNQYVDDQHILDRFEEIFRAPAFRPVAQTPRQILARMNHTRIANAARRLRIRLRQWR